MIVGKVELLTVRRIAGWAYENHDAALSIRVRVRNDTGILAEIICEPVMPRHEDDGRKRSGHPFYIELPERLDTDHLAQLAIEAAGPGDIEWTPLPKPIVTPKSYTGPHASLISAPENAMQFASELAPFRPWMAEFWSDQPKGPPPSPKESRPLFIVGAARSGTSAICACLRQATRYRGFREGHLLEIAIRFAEAVGAHFMEKDQWIRAGAQAGYHVGRLSSSLVLAEAMELLRRLTAGYTTPFWFDKTPGHTMIISTPLLAQTWPEARFIFMKRRGLEVLKSRQQRFDSLFANGCWAWTNVMASWRNVRYELGDRAIELDQRMLLDDPDLSAARIGVLLNLTPEEVQSFAAALRQERPQVTDPAHPVIGDIAELGWTMEQVETFRTICGPEMDAYGYTYDARYNLRTAATSKTDICAS